MFGPVFLERGAINRCIDDPNRSEAYLLSEPRSELRIKNDRNFGRCWHSANFAQHRLAGNEAEYPMLSHLN